MNLEYPKNMRMDPDEIRTRGIVLDTNILLSLYRYDYESANAIIAALRSLRDRLYVPYMVWLEFQNSYKSVISDQILAFDDLSRTLRESLDNLKAAIGKLQIQGRHPALDTDSIVDRYQETLNLQVDRVNALRDNYLRLVAKNLIEETLAELLQDRIGSPPNSQARINELNLEAERRFQKKIPPGFRDQNKRQYIVSDGLIFNAKYSDYLIWNDIVQFARKEALSGLLLVSDDLKDDWIDKTKGTRSLRIELEKELNTAASVQSVVHMSSADLIQFVSDNLDFQVSRKTISDVLKYQEFIHLKNESALVPYVLVLSADGEAAVYDRGYGLIRESASDALIAFAREHSVRVQDSFSFSLPEQIPTWLNDGSSCLSYWLWEDQPKEYMPMR